MLKGADLRTGKDRGHMPSVRDAYSDAELAAVVNHVIGHFGVKAGAAWRRPFGTAGRRSDRAPEGGPWTLGIRRHPGFDAGAPPGNPHPVAARNP